MKGFHYYGNVGVLAGFFLVTSCTSSLSYLRYVALNTLRTIVLPLAYVSRLASATGDLDRKTEIMLPRSW